jgi:hypothetical protein
MKRNLMVVLQAYSLLRTMGLLRLLMGGRSTFIETASWMCLLNNYRWATRFVSMKSKGEQGVQASTVKLIGKHS